MSRFWSDKTRDLAPYTPGEQPRVDGLIKLNTNEHPLAPSQLAIAAISAAISARLRHYPDPESPQLRLAIAEREGLALEQVFVGNGSDEVLAHIFAALLSGSEAINVPDITYSFYPVWAKLTGIDCCSRPLADDFSIDVDTLRHIQGPILLANPNAPTGIALDLETIEDLVLTNTERLVVIDEAYYGFGGATAAPLLERADNLLITRSFSKSHALAGLRVGYALGSAELIEGLVRVKDSFNSYPLDVLAQAGAEAAIRDGEWRATLSLRIVNGCAQSCSNGIFSSAPRQQIFCLYAMQASRGRPFLTGCAQGIYSFAAGISRASITIYALALAQGKSVWHWSWR